MSAASRPKSEYRSAQQEDCPVTNTAPPDSAPPPAARHVPCPTCGRPALFAPANPARPFCSDRCRGVDLGAWANERYRVAAPPAQEDDDTLPD